MSPSDVDNTNSSNKRDKVTKNYEVEKCEKLLISFNRTSKLTIVFFFFSKNDTFTTRCFTTRFILCKFFWKFYLIAALLNSFSYALFLTHTH